jgi:decaprenyl-phosphate phosphoribosyltransferase
MRLKQSIKNLLVVLAPLASGEILGLISISRILFAFLVFTIAASSVYVLNDCIDIQTDKCDLEKRNGPITSGKVRRRNAFVFSFMLGTVSLLMATILGGSVFLLILTYLMINIFYSTHLKTQPVIEFFCVASGFVIRAIVGGQSTGIVISESFILIVAWASIFVVVSKRMTEKKMIKELDFVDSKVIVTRAVLNRYSENFLIFALTVTGSLFLFSYSIWALSFTDNFHRYSIVLVAILLFRFACDLDNSRTKSTVDKFLGDPFLIFMGLLLSIFLIIPTWF